MVDVVSKRCANPGCTTTANYGEKNNGTRKFCSRHAEEGMVHARGRPSKNSNVSGRTDGTEASGSGTASRAGSGGRRRSRDPPPTPAEPSSERSSGTNKRARRSAGGGDLHPVRVKREGADNSVPDDEEATACPEPDAVVKTEDMEVPCKVEPTKGAG